MEFNEKLKELRKQRGLTQEELAKDLYVSRTAVSKWESKRGVPNIESLKAISSYFSVSVDELLSGEEILKVADEDSRKRENRTRDLVFGLLDCSLIIFLFLPFFAHRTGGTVKEVSLLSLFGISPVIKTVYILTVFGIIFMGILTLALQNFEAVLWVKYKYKISVALSAFGTVLFMVTLQPYASLFAFVFLAVKSLMLIKWG